MFDPDRCVGVENTNSFKHVSHFSEDAVVVDWDGNIIRRGNDPDLVAYRKAFQKRYDEKYGS